NARKKQLLSKLFSATRDHLTIVRNIENIMAWMERTDTAIYNDVRHGTFLIPRVDRILDRTAMLASARQSPTTMRIVETEAPSHFITLDSKEWVPVFEHQPAAALN
ncbi:MAG: alpha/beta hydrolase, partial [Marinobacter sp.]|nr:alpha/beta hydrolase [Marinobacter sp.]